MADRAARKSYAEKRDFGRTPEPSGDASRAAGRKASVGKAGGRAAASFVVQKHHARRLHWDFRLEHEGVLWSWAVPKGPSLDPADKRLAVHVEDHPLDYRDFSGTIPEGNYGAGTVAIWDRGTWAPLGDAAADLARGELKFRLDGERLRGGFVLVRLKPRGGEHAENWLLIKEKDDAVRPGGDAAALEGDVAGAATPAGDTAETPVPAGDAADTAPAAPRGRRRRAAPVAAAADEPASAPKRRRRAAAGSNAAPLPDRVPPELATAVEQAPSGAGWVSEIKFDGYRMLARKDGRDVRLITRNGLDWTHRLPTIARAVGRLGATRLLVDGELVALGRDGVTSFAALQEALSHGDDRKLVLYAFDLLAEDDADLRERPLLDRKARLAPLCSADGTIRYSEHLTEDAARIRERACQLGLEGLVCKRADSPYRPGRGTDWVKVKCEHREEMIILGATRPRGAREGLGAIHLGYRDGSGRLWYAGGCGTGFSDAVLRDLAARLAAAGATRPTGLVTPEKPPAGLAWCTPSLVCEIRHAGFTGGGLLRHARFLGLREDKDADEVVRDPPVDAAPPRRVRAALPAPVSGKKEPAKKHAARAGAPAAVAVDAGPQRTPQRTPTRRVRGGGGRGADAAEIAGVRVSHPDRELWPGLTKRTLATYWEAVADAALGGVAHRPLALLRCPDGIDGESFFQKHATPGFPDAIHEGACDGAPYLSINDTRGLVSLAQMSAIELHSWGSSLNDPGRADRIVLDLDPGDGVGFPAVIAAANDLRRAIEAAGLACFPRTSGGKGLHLVIPLRPGPDWNTVRAWSRAFSVACEGREPKRFIASTTRKAPRTGRILIDWLRNGLGSTAIASYSPRARAGAAVATPLAWREVAAGLDPAAFTIETIPARLAKRRRDPWDGFDAAAAAALPSLVPPSPVPPSPMKDP